MTATKKKVFRKAKLVRDKVQPRDELETVQSANSAAGRHIALCLKLHEEAAEIASAPADPFEYADLLAVMIELARLHGLTPEHIFDAFKRKHEAKGGFRMARIWTRWMWDGGE